MRVVQLKQQIPLIVALSLWGVYDYKYIRQQLQPHPRLTNTHDLQLNLKGGAYPRPRMVARVVTTLQLFAAETCNKFLKIEHHDSIVYSKHELILTFLAGATSDLTAGNTTQERLDLPARFLQQILLLPYFTM